MRKFFRKRKSKNNKPSGGKDSSVAFIHSPVELNYLGLDECLTSIPVDKYRSHLLGFLAQDHPFVKTIQEIKQGLQQYQDSELKRFYNDFQPKSFCDVLSIYDQTFSEVPAMGAVTPWRARTPLQQLKKVCVDTSVSPLLGVEAYKFGVKPEGNFGWQFFGPVSDAVGLLEFERLKSVYESISTKGYCPPPKSHIHGEFLISDNDWVWINLGGKHRCAALIAMNYSEIPIRVRGEYGAAFVRRSEVDYWPNVLNGLFSRGQALQFFDKMMLGRTC